MLRNHTNDGFQQPTMDREGSKITVALFHTLVHKHYLPKSSELFPITHPSCILFSKTTASNEAGGTTINFEAQEKFLERK